MSSGVAGLTDEQLRALLITERVNSSISIASIIFVVTTYIFAPGFNKPINRLIYFASFGNLGSNVAALISEAGPLAGSAAAVCKFQAFLVQMFLGVDCYWAFCMAVNVYLVFFRGYTVDQLRSLDLAYLLICYGLSFIPAFVFIFINTRERGPIYGPAVIWCWISIDWDFMRFIFLYGIVW
jgi:Slime mold cyclic AMP receptor